MTRLTGFVLRHKAFVALSWIALTIIGFATIGTTTGRLSTNFSMPGPGFTTDARIMHLYHNGGAQAPTVLLAETTAGTNRPIPDLGRAFAAAVVAPGIRVEDFATTGDPHFSAANGRSAFALVFMPASRGPFTKDLTPTITSAVQAAAPVGIHIGATGLAQLQAPTQGSSKGNGVLVETLFGGLGALAVLAFVFASFLALVPLAIALVSIPTTFLLVLGLTGVMAVSFIVEFLVGLIGLGVAIDYSLLVATRWREGRSSGLSNEAAVTQAMVHAGRTVVFSGLTVAIGLVALVVLPVPFLRSIGAVGFLIPLVSVGAAVTLLPVMLATIGPRLSWPGLRSDAQASRPWSAWARLITRHRGLAALAGVVVVGALIVPLFSMKMGDPNPLALTTAGPASRTVAALAADQLPLGALTPIEVLAKSGTGQAVARQAGQIPGVYSATTLLSADYHRGGTDLVSVIPLADDSSTGGQSTVSRVAAILGHNPAVLGVGGNGVAQSDFNHDVYGNFPLMLGLISLVIFLLLARVFRSVVLALKAVVLNLASLAAAYGVMVLVWQMGYGSKALWGIPATGAITQWVPVMVFAFLFGLSMDYEVFILTRMRETYDSTGSTTSAIVGGIGRTGRLVTSAALILFLSFVALSTTPFTPVQMLATGLGAGILVDAVIIRSLLVPALVGLFGRANWWFPPVLARLLRVRVPDLALAPIPARATTGNEPVAELIGR